MPDMQQDKVVTVQHDPWEGEVEVTLKGTFTFVIDSLWDVYSEERARELVEIELSDYIGEAFNDERFTERWKVRVHSE